MTSRSTSPRIPLLPLLLLVCSATSSASSLPHALPQPSNKASWFPSVEGWTGKIKPFWFGANHTGLDSEATLALLAKHSVAGYGWQTGGAGQDGLKGIGRGDAWGAAAVTRAVDYMRSHGRGKAVTVFQYRQIQVALRLYAQCALAADDPGNEAFWLHDFDTHTRCSAGQPWGTDDYFWNFTNVKCVSGYREREKREGGGRERERRSVVLAA